MEKWEYLYETLEEEASKFNARFNAFLNSKGSEGWELVEHHFCHGQSQETPMDYVSCLFKRKK